MPQSHLLTMWQLPSGVLGRPFVTDVCVPISRLAECVQVTALDVAELNIPIALFGHVGDGNFHFVMMLDPDDARERQLAEDLNHRLIGRALEMEGTAAENTASERRSIL